MGMCRCSCSAVLLALVGLPAVAMAATDVFQVPFSTDPIVTPTAFDKYEFAITGTGQFGPDGPWQAAVFMLGYHIRPGMTDRWHGGPVVPMWPTGSVITQLLTVKGRGFYNQSENATQPWIEFGNGGDNDLKLADFNAHQRSQGQGIHDYVTMMNSRFEAPGYANINATIAAMNISHIQLRNGRGEYIPNVGNLALGRPADVDFGGFPWPGKSILEQMKEQGHIKTNSFGLHLGSAPLNQRGSLILGGYDEARIVGPIASFQMILGTPVIFLADIALGVATGISHLPTTPETPISVWDGSATDLVSEHLGGRKGNIVITPNPAVPGIYLPSPTCANAAKYLPVTYSVDTGYYLWDTTAPLYSQLINSASYLAFTFGDHQAKNVTIKIPLKLLNLTLDKPITDVPTPYFPCHDVGKTQETGMWELGRAFLQGAFFGINFERNYTFLAQAPGPAMSQSVVHPFAVDDISSNTIISQPEKHFVDSWMASWPEAVETEAPRKGLSGGAIAGIVIGVLAGLGLMGAGLWFLWRRRRQAREKEAEPSELHTGGLHRHKKKEDVKDGDVKEFGPPESGVQEAADTPVVELDSPKPPMSEAPTSPGVYEMGTPLPFGNEAPTSPGVYEMPAEPLGSRGETGNR
ncbi:aspartic peptidase domain-containing protein [Podospora aff. communis PSN243]|uniref:Aspartic peptidase domain-containing protein n=1 Tax=Podospora aff. communis PSN243 TaxID=3040156 RepID=A0AAV9G4N8_9PEZI|nr:aspartic peptidase domain-containing protein [Podospora aff. communis PSN243]